MDLITQRMLKSFEEDLGETFSDETKKFEYFVNDCIVNYEYGCSDFDLEDVTTGDSTQGIDGIAIIVNKKLVNSTDEIKEKYQTSNSTKIT